jgi:hypothetical protein
MNNTLQTQFYDALQKTIKNATRRRRVSEVLASCPRSGGGVHRWLFVTALKLYRHCPEKGELARLLTEATANCGREIPDEEIENAIINSQPIAEGRTAQGAMRSGPRWPQRNDEQISAIVQDGPNLTELEAMSPVRSTDGQPHTEEIIDMLFPGNPLLCAAPKKELALTRTREEWRRFMANQQFIVPSPMTARYGKTKSGRDSSRSLANTGPRRFLVVEFDRGDFDQHAALLIHLARFAPLVLAVHSGNKSLHGWFYCEGEPDQKVEKFFRFAVSLGGDHATWTRCQFVRMPDGQRDDGKRQRVVYFDPKRMVEGK